ncbi:hypothetical protein [Streptomyces sp. NPDC059247]|uniref:hypothetical protein n=1 Tax=Streptomyces sp. NPDC059247 TaxID=3346790 RepID=UPI0036B6B4E2
MPRKAELFELLENICRAAQWHAATAATEERERGAGHRRRTGWETAARAAVHAGRSGIEGIASSVRLEEAMPARRLLRVMDGTPPFPRL